MASNKPPAIVIEGLRGSRMPSGYLLGRVSSGTGAVELISPAQAKGAGLIPGGGGSTINPANPTAVAGDAAINGVATTYMRSDAAPAIQLCSSSIFGLAKVDNTTITASAGVISAASQTTIASHTILSNITGGTAVALGNTVSAVLDLVGSAQGDILFRDAATWNVLAPGAAGTVLQSNGAGANPSYVAASAVTAASDASVDQMFFGNGADGNLTVTTPTTRLNRDMYYANLTINATGRINTNGFRIFVSSVLDISAAPANAIVHWNGTDGILNGGNATSFAGGSGAGNPVPSTIGGAAAGGNGANGGTGAGPQGNSSGTTNNNLNSKSGNSGKGGTGNGGANAGGALRAGTTTTKAMDVARLDVNFGVMAGATNWIQMQGGAAAPGGGAGGGDGVNNGGGGAGGAAGGGMVFVAARTINRGASTTAACINANGGDGGAGGGNAHNVGGGGGGGGAGGGWLYVIYRLLTGATATNCLSARGGNGGAGGLGGGTGIGGDGGDSGSRGRLSIYNLAAGTNTFADSDTTTVAGSPGSGVTGGAGGIANTQQASL